MKESRSYSSVRRTKNWVKNGIRSPYNIMVAAAVAALACLVIVPLIEMVVTTFKLAARDVRRVEGAQAGDWSLYYWKKLLCSEVSQNMLYKPLMHSLLIATAVSVFSIGLGGAIAWLMVRSDLPFKKFFSLAMIVPYMIPSWCKSMAWIAVFKTARIGGTQGFLSYLGLEPPDWLAYGPVAIICVLTIHYYAYAYLLISASFRSINSELEEMGEILGAGKLLMLRKITFPLVMPAIASSFILIFSKAMGTFGVPAFLGLKTGYYTISTMLYTSIKQQQTAMAFSISLILIGIAAVIIFINQQVIGTRKSYATIGGKGGRSNVLSLNKWKPMVVCLLFLFLGFCVFLPIGILVLQSLMLKLGDYSPSNFSLHYWVGLGKPDIFYGEPGVFRNPQFLQVLGNSLKLVVVASLVATVFGQLIGYVTSRGRQLKSGKLVEQLVFIPYLIPSVAFGGIYLSMFSQPQQIFGVTLVPALYGTFALLTLVSVVKHLPFAARAGTSNMLQISGELEEAATIEGAGFFRRFVKIVFPLSKGGFISGFMLIFVSIMKELDLIILIMTPTTSTLPYLAFRYQNGNSPQASDCVAIVMFSIVFLVYAIANLSGKADLAKSMAG